MTKEFKIVRALVPLLRAHPWAISIIITLGVLSSLAEGIGISLFIPFLQSLDQASYQAHTGNWLVDSLGGLFNNVPPDDRLLVISACIFASIFLKANLSYSHGALYSWLDARITHRLRSDIFKQLLTVSYGFLERRDTGDLINTLSSETWRASNALSSLVSIIITICTLVVYIALLLLISWKLTLIVTAAMLLIAMVVRLITRRVKALGQEATRANAQLAIRMMEGLAGMQVIRNFGREPYEQDRFDQKSSHVSSTFLKLGIVSGAVYPVYEVLSAALLVSILLVMLQNQQNLPALLVFIFVLYRLQPKVMALDGARVDLNSLTGAVEEVTSLLDTTDKPYLHSGELDRGLGEGIRLDHVTFRYHPSEEPALRDASAHIPAGKTTALVGPSGAGKSTLVKLLFRHYDVDEGTIYIGDCALPTLDLEAWRRRIAMVSQDGYIFNTTVRENIAYGRLEATEGEIEAAARQADAHDFIRQLPQGYDTKIGDRGVRLSGGQKQRLTVARAIVRDPDILILDEATNALDSISENVIQETLARLRQDRTVIVIAHRLATVEEADQIITLNEGRVCEQGTFQELLERNGLFAKLYNLQYRMALTNGS